MSSDQEKSQMGADPAQKTILWKDSTHPEGYQPTLKMLTFPDGRLALELSVHGNVTVVPFTKAEQNPTPSTVVEGVGGGLTVQANEKIIALKPRFTDGRFDGYDQVDGPCLDSPGYIYDLVRYDDQDKPSLDSPKGLGVQPDIGKFQIQVQLLGMVRQIVLAWYRGDNLDLDLMKMRRWLELYDGLNLDWSKALTLTDGSVSDENPESLRNLADSQIAYATKLEHEIKAVNEFCDRMRLDYGAKIEALEKQLKAANDRYARREQKYYEWPKQRDELKAEVNRLREGLVVAKGFIASVGYIDGVNMIDELLAPKKEENRNG